ncbi:metal-dependent hydrolase [Chondrinema litorale]|uniref:metal-dependent hydrolase n=1 Tax=Chondrinema litorale TaxID=2994555 RepID=UPI0025427623|nr:metal-dependent hydrolase [Chondrinema litorale]UZR92316.1 metal-dependent hydrolase [Chondrinema litorale]
MDSLTQIVLGAAVGEAVCGKKIGNKAMLWGAIAGTIPDLDVLLSPFQDLVQYLSNHRAFTHSFTFAILFSPLFAWLMTKAFPNSKANYSDWLWLYFLGFVTHALLDTFTTWGTQLFYPFNNYGFALYNIFVIDPFYTVPFLLFLLIAAFYKRDNPKRKLFNNLGLIISSLYLFVSLINQYIASKVFEDALHKQNIAYTDYINKATPLNIILWSLTTKTEDGYYFAYYSLFDDTDEVKFDFYPANHHLLDNYKDHPKVKRLLEITKGYYTVEKSDNEFIIRDLRFGQFNGWQRNSSGEFVFEYHMVDEGNNNLTFYQKDYSFKPDKEYLTAYFERITGKN